MGTAAEKGAVVARSYVPLIPNISERMAAASVPPQGQN
jgi:hypothetical protein